MPDTTRVLWDEFVQLARRFDAYTLQAFNPVYPSPADRR